MTILSPSTCTSLSRIWRISSRKLLCWNFLFCSFFSESSSCPAVLARSSACFSGRSWTLSGRVREQMLLWLKVVLSGDVAKGGVGVAHVETEAVRVIDLLPFAFLLRGLNIVPRCLECLLKGRVVESLEISSKILLIL